MRINDGGSWSCKYCGKKETEKQRRLDLDCPCGGYFIQDYGDVLAAIDARIAELQKTRKGILDFIRRNAEPWPWEKRFREPSRKGSSKSPSNPT